MAHAESPPRGFAVSTLVVGDIPEIAAIERQSFSAPWSLGTFHHLLFQYDHFHGIVARETGHGTQGALAGYAAWFDLGEELHLISMAVHAGLRRRGVGRLLLEHVLDLARRRGARVSLEVRTSNGEAIGFYTSCGFIPVACRPHYYEENGEDALVMLFPEKTGGT